MGHDKSLPRMLWKMVRTVPNLAVEKRKSVLEWSPGAADAELDLKAWIGFKCLHPPPICEPWEGRTVILRTWYQVLDKRLLKAIKTWKAAMKDTLLSLERGSQQASYLPAFVPHISTGHVLQAPSCSRSPRYCKSTK